MVIIILISIIFFKTYFEKESVNNVSEKVEEKKDIKKKESNFIHNKNMFHKTNSVIIILFLLN